MQGRLEGADEVLRRVLPDGTISGSSCIADAECAPAEGIGAYPPSPHELVEVKVTRNFNLPAGGPVAMEMVVHTPFVVVDDDDDD